MYPPSLPGFRARPRVVLAQPAPRAYSRPFLEPLLDADKTRPDCPQVFTQDSSSVHSYRVLDWRAQPLDVISKAPSGRISFGMATYAEHGPAASIALTYTAIRMCVLGWAGHLLHIYVDGSRIYVGACRWACM